MPGLKDTAILLMSDWHVMLTTSNGEEMLSVITSYRDQLDEIAHNCGLVLVDVFKNTNTVQGLFKSK